MHHLHDWGSIAMILFILVCLYWLFSAIVGIIQGLLDAVKYLRVQTELNRLDLQHEIRVTIESWDKQDDPEWQLHALLYEYRALCR